MIKLHLLSNAHIDTVWQWQKDEGIGVAVSTFSAAADFCEEYDNYVFCHSDAIFYEYVEKYSPELFLRIKKLVAQKKWIITSGWYLQCDCNMPSGEAMIRQIYRGLEYFSDKFGDDFIMPKTAVNFDCPGHSAGLIQILNDFGYKYFAYCRGSSKPDRKGFIWKSERGELLAYHLPEGYNTHHGKIEEVIDYYLNDLPDQKIQLCPWGVGNHGGGASRCDIEKIEELKTKYKEVEILHSSPDEFFRELENSGETFSTVENLGNVNQGTYSAEYQVKHLYFRLENLLFRTEKLSAFASVNGFDYPFAELKSAETDLIETQFHDSLPGTTIREVEDELLCALRHGIETLDRINTACLYFLLRGKSRAKDGEFPIFVVNPHPYKVSLPIDCELMLADQNWDTENIYYPVLFDGDKQIPVQLVKESSSVPIDWRKRISFTAELDPCTVKRYSCYFELKPISTIPAIKQDLVLFGKNSVVEINVSTGLLKSYKVGGKEFLTDGSFALKIYENSCDPWGFEFNKYHALTGEFRLMNINETKEFLSDENVTSPINVVENGDVKTVVEAYFIHKNSAARVMYTLYKDFDHLEINVDLFNSEKDCKVKLEFLTPFANGKLYGKTMFYYNNLPCDGSEQVAQDNVVISDENSALSVINFGNYGLSCKGGVIGYTLLTGCGYSAEPIEDRKILKSNRFDYRMDQGERNFRFIIEGGDIDKIYREVNEKSLIYRQPPLIMNFFPSKDVNHDLAEFTVSNKAVIMESFRKKKDGKFILRLFNSLNAETDTELCCKTLNIKEKIQFKGYEYKTFIIENNEITESVKNKLFDTEQV